MRLKAPTDERMSSVSGVLIHLLILLTVVAKSIVLWVLDLIELLVLLVKPICFVVFSENKLVIRFCFHFWTMQNSR